MIKDIIEKIKARIPIQDLLAYIGERAADKSEVYSNCYVETLSNEVNLHFTNLEEDDDKILLPQATETNAGVMGSSDKIKLNSSVNIGTTKIISKNSKLYIVLEDNNNNIKEIEIPIVGTNSPGLITPGDKEKLANIDSYLPEIVTFTPEDRESTERTLAIREDLIAKISVLGAVPATLSSIKLASEGPGSITYFNGSPVGFTCNVPGGIRLHITANYNSSARDEKFKILVEYIKHN